METEILTSNTNNHKVESNSQKDYIKNELTFDTSTSDLLDKTVYRDCTENNEPENEKEEEVEEEEEPEWMDILGNGQLRKKSLVKPDKKSRPNQGDFCTVKIIGRLEDGTVIEDKEDMLVQLGDHEVVQGLDLAIALMDVGEVSEVEVAARFAYGDRGRDPDIPPGAKITYEVELKKVEMEPEIDNMDFEQRLSLGNKKREQGNWWFSRDEPTLAIQCYRRSLDFLVTSEVTSNDENSSEKKIDTELEILLEYRTKVYNNLAAAQLKTEAHEAALESVNNVLRVEPENVKALFRKGRILHKKGEYTEAMTTLQKAAKLDPDSKAISQELTIIGEISARNSVYEKNLYRKMLGTTKSSTKTNTNSNKNASFAQKYPSLSFSSKNPITKIALWSLIGGTLATVTGIIVYKLTF